MNASPRLLVFQVDCGIVVCGPHVHVIVLPRVMKNVHVDSKSASEG